MLLTTLGVDRLRAALAAGRAERLSSSDVDGISLGAAFELACTRLTSEEQGWAAAPLFARHARTGSLLNAESVYERLKGTSRSEPIPLFETPRFEAAAIISSADLGQGPGDLFL